MLSYKITIILAWLPNSALYIQRPLTIYFRGGRSDPMSLLTIHFSDSQYAGVKYVIEMLKQKLHDDIHKDDRQPPTELQYPIIIEPSIEANNIIISPKLPQFQLINHAQPLYEATAYAVGQFIVEHCENEIIDRMLRGRCRQTKLEPQKVAMYCYNILNNDPWEPLGKRFTEQDRARRRSKIIEELVQHFESNTHLDLTGFIQFRMYSYKQELREVIEYAIDEYVLDQQYEEFMMLLKYFVQLQETKTELVHLVQQEGSSFMLCDENMKPLELNNEHDRIVAEMLETEINIEDIVISSLISASPQKIIVHAKHQDYQVIRTVKAIFAERAQYCSTCPMCRQSRDERVPFH